MKLLVLVTLKDRTTNCSHWVTLFYSSSKLKNKCDHCRVTIQPKNPNRLNGKQYPNNNRALNCLSMDSHTKIPLSEPRSWLFNIAAVYSYEHYIYWLIVHCVTHRAASTGSVTRSSKFSVDHFLCLISLFDISYVVILAYHKPSNIW